MSESGVAELRGTHHKQVGEGFGGSIVDVSSQVVDKFYIENQDLLEKSGSRGILRAMKIPPGFFESQDSVLQRDILIAQKADCASRHESIRMVVKDGKVIFSAPVNDTLPKDPKEVLSMNDEQWHLSREDWMRGYFTYVHQPKGFEKGLADGGSYEPVAFLSMPILYSDVTILELGMYRWWCSNGMRDSVFSHQMNIRGKDFDPTIFQSLIQGSASALATAADRYGDVLNRMKDRPQNLHDARTLFNKMMLPTPQVPKTLLNACQQHIDRLEGSKQVPERSPEKIETAWDVMDLMTFNSKELPSVTSQSKAERSMFSFLVKEYAPQEQVQVLDLSDGALN